MSQSLSDSIRRHLRSLTETGSLEPGAVSEILHGVLDSEPEEEFEARPLLAGLLCSLQVLGVNERALFEAASALGSRSLKVSLSSSDKPLYDTCGTGGDGADLVNISTLAALAIASVGFTVAKHGNRSVSSRCGSADLLEALGFELELDPAQAASSLESRPFTFLFAPKFHPAFARLAPLRRQLGVRTLFNSIGPLLNPAPISHQLIGVFDPKLMAPMARAAYSSGRTRVLSVHGEGGLDEASPWGSTKVLSIDETGEREFSVHASDIGLPPIAAHDLKGGGPEVNAERSLRMLQGERGPLAHAVAFNGAFALMLDETEFQIPKMKDAYRSLLEELHSGRVHRLLEPQVD